MAKDASGPAPISEESIGYLEEVKKGKPRKFAMICKGTEVISLVVYKKGNVEKHKKEAKQSGKGQFYFGVVDGKGIDIRFVLARADGFESPPVKPTSLKGFLDESAELKCKPYFEIVDAAPLVLDEDDPLVARFLKLQEAALGACDAHPDRSAEINALCSQIGSYLDQEQPDPAVAKLDELESLLGSLRGSLPPSSPPPIPPPLPPTSQPDSSTDEFEELYNGLLTTLPGDLQRLSLVNDVVAAKIQKIVDAGKILAQKGDFQRAYTYLDQASQALAKALGTGRVEQAAEVIPEGIVAARKAALARAQIRWEAALTATRKRLKPVQDEIQEEFPLMAQGLNNILDSYEKDLLDELLAGQAKAHEDELAAAVGETLEKLHSLRSEADADDVFSYLEECGIPVKAAFAEAFDDVEELLQS